MYLLSLSFAVHYFFSPLYPSLCLCIKECVCVCVCVRVHTHETCDMKSMGRKHFKDTDQPLWQKQFKSQILETR